ncbi:MAG: hypothetical protein M1576_04175 [Deltaproteobacteria bacterium]|nr:hypothetical protein [Deltaproteobacteria bacterium]
MDKQEYMREYWQTHKKEIAEKQKGYHSEYWQKNKERLSLERKAKYKYSKNGRGHRGKCHEQDKPASRETIKEWCSYIDNKWGVSMDTDKMGRGCKYD